MMLAMGLVMTLNIPLNFVAMLQDYLDMVSIDYA
jgi:hypothetical protein